MSTIHITVNGNDHSVPEGCTLAALVTQLQIEAGQPQDPAAVATAVNEVFVPRLKREATPLSEGDQVFTFSPITGG